jgi:diaminopimelate epimerase
LRCAAKYYCQAKLAAGTRLKQLNLRLHKTGKTLSARVFWRKNTVASVEIDMGKPEILWKDRDWHWKRFKLKLNFLSMGNPHCVIWKTVADPELLSLGPVLARDPLFPQGCNVEFVRLISSREAEVKVWERGAGVTLACGSGACAVFALGLATGVLASPALIKLPGGALQLRQGKDGHIYMRGPAEEVFQGKFII